jgi:hypothetical protein
LHTLRLQELIDVGLIEAETPLFMLPFTSLLTEARITAEGTIRLQDGLEYTDPSKAAAEATLYDPGTPGQYPEDPRSPNSASEPAKDLRGPDSTVLSIALNECAGQFS